MTHYLLTCIIYNMDKEKKVDVWDSERIKSLRRHLKLSQAGMADQLGIRQQTISEWETGQYEPRGASVKLLHIVADRSGFKYKA